ncbi:phospholipase B1, membrane-associated-like [Periophthalmus magnuspinnatus]|uniref:phospholipase B1, membrane-associated-like n=1 Tax=Periophthalmus magnuspinnatus TaxID=409849 RepID=UPI00145B632B|nr:phospholipase B1, membrane-associated-like [Periophthalmus magnuspinnatus]
MALIRRGLYLVLVSVLGLIWNTAVIAFPCDKMFTSPSPPATVDRVRPSDVSVLSSVSLDSHSPELSSVLSKLQELMSLFSPSLLGPFSDPPSFLSPPLLSESSLMEQAEELSRQLQDKQDSWKLVLFFIQMDQLCACEQEQALSAVDETIRKVDEALQFLQSQLKKTIVSVALWDEEQVSLQNRNCFCSGSVREGEARLVRAMQTFALQKSLGELLERKSWFQKSTEDFTVVLQDSPLMRETPASSPSYTDSYYTDKLLVQMWIQVLQPPVDEAKQGDIALPCPSELRPFLRTSSNSYLKENNDMLLLIEPVSGTEMPCVDLNPSPSIPNSVHELRPGDVKVVAAMGDSLTAGNGVGSNPNNLLDVLTQYRGLSWSIGGDDNLTSVTTLPNILKHFNPNVTGFSLGTGKQTSPQAALNQAVGGATSQSLLTQAQALVKRMKNDSKINFAEDWKVITIFIGGNDLCDFCKNSLLYSVETYIKNVRETLDYLHKEVPRAMVNLVEPLHITPLREMHLDTSLKCPTWLVNILCPCVIMPKDNSAAMQQLETLNRNYQTALHELVETGRYDTHSNFTVVVQPFFREIVVPRLPDGRPDRSYFSPDCFHLSQKAHKLMARSLWNNMLEPLGNKTSKQDFMTEIKLNCPTKTSPYIRTYNNSDYIYPGPPPTPSPITNWGSDFSCVDLAPSNPVPTSVHKLRPADIKVVAALGDSATAGVAAKANNLFELSKQYRGVSWSIGGDASLETVTTLPNILKKFNPKLVGFSVGQLAFRKGFNMAEPGARSLDIQTQVEALIKALKNNKEVNFEQDWKLVTIYVGEMDLCNYCFDQYNLTAKQFSKNLQKSLDMLHQSVPRVLVNVAQVLQIDPLKTVQRNTIGCSLLQRTHCPCVVNPSTNSPEIEVIKRINHEYQVELEFLLSSDQYDGKEDFAVVLQPFLHNYFLPYIGEGEVDTSFYSLDCFHLSERAQAEMAIALWNNMLEPVGRKTAFNNYTYDRSKIHCPSQTHPFIFTKMNSLPELPATTPPATTPTVSTAPTPPVTGHEPLCPPNVPVWVPVLAAVGSLLAGFAVAWVVCSCIKKNRSVNMKGTSF